MLGDREFAKEIGTSKITIGHILQELQAEGVVERIPGKGTFLRDRANLRLPAVAGLESDQGSGGRPFVMILAVLNVPWQTLPVEDDWSQRVAMSVEHQLQQGGAKTIVRNRFGVEEHEIEMMIDNGLRSGADRILFVWGSLAEPSRSAIWENHLVRIASGANGAPTPVVQVAFNPKVCLPVDLVAFDGECGSQTATQHLIDLGHRNIVFAGPSPDIPETLRDWAVDRVRGFRRALQLSGIEPPTLLEETSEIMNTPRLIRGDPTQPDVDRWDHLGRSVSRRILAEPDVTAVVAANDSVAAAIIDEVRKAGKLIPEDLSVVGFDNNYMSAALDLTTVHVPVEQMGEAACALLLDPGVGKPGRKTQILIDPMLVVRGSTAVPAP